MSPAGVLFATFAVLMLLGSPITVALGVAAMAALYTVDQNLVTLVQIAFTSVNSFPIMALPAFMLVGALMECAGISRRLVAIAENIVGPIPGGLAVSTALACVFFGAISGSGPATTAAVGMLMIPAMIRRDSARAMRLRPRRPPGAWASSSPRASRWSSMRCRGSNPSPKCSSPG